MSGSRELNHLHPKLQPLAVEFLKKCAEQIQGAEVRIICTYRSNEVQAEMFAQGRTKMGPRCACRVQPCKRHPLGLIVTKAKPGESQHNFQLGGSPASRAFDYGVFVDGKYDRAGSHRAWKQAGQIAMDLGLNWFGAPGSKFFELAHVQLK